MRRLLGWEWSSVAQAIFLHTKTKLEKEKPLGGKTNGEKIKRTGYWLFWPKNLFKIFYFMHTMAGPWKKMWKIFHRGPRFFLKKVLRQSVGSKRVTYLDVFRGPSHRLRNNKKRRAKRAPCLLALGKSALCVEGPMDSVIQGIWNVDYKFDRTKYEQKKGQSFATRARRTERNSKKLLFCFSCPENPNERTTCTCRALTHAQPSSSRLYVKPDADSTRLEIHLNPPLLCFFSTVFILTNFLNSISKESVTRYV